jgi:hypothetical protein
MPRPTVTADTDASPQPWWRHPMVWLVVGGPLVVVVAAIVTAWIAIRGADPVVSGGTNTQAERPAVQARNQGAAAPASRP